MKTVQYSIVEKTEFVVMRSESEDGDHGEGAGETRGTFDSEVAALNAAQAFTRQEPHFAKPADKVIGANGVFWERKTGWSDEPNAIA